MGAARAEGGRGPVIRVFLLAFVIYAYFMPRWADWNIDSRLDLVHAIVDDHTFRIDRYHYNTWDKAVLGGHYYSDKAPGTAFLGAVVYAGFSLLRSAPVTGDAIRGLEGNSAWNVAITYGQANTQFAPAPAGTSLGGCQRAGIKHNVQYIPWGNRLYPPFRAWALSKYVITIGVNALLSALFMAFFFWFLAFFALKRRTRWLLTGLFALGTIAFPYSTVFYSHQLAAGFLFVAFALLYLRAKGQVGKWAPPAIGFLMGFALLTEYTVVLIVAGLGIYALWVLRRRLRDFAPLCLAGAVPIVGLMVYNNACFGSPLDTGYSHDFCWSAAQAAGVAGFTAPKIGPLLDLTFTPFRGLFFMSPFLLLALPGAYVMWRSGRRAESILCVVVSVVFIVTLSAYWGWNGGKVEGPRYLVPIIPFLTLPIAWLIDRMSDRSIGWIVVAATAGWSLFSVWAQFLGGILFPISWLPDPIFQYSLSELGANHIAPNAGLFIGLSGWATLLPLIVAVLVIAAWGLPKKRGEIRQMMAAWGR